MARTVSPLTRQRAQVLAAGGHLWSRVTVKRNGQRAYLIPSTTDPEHVAYYTAEDGSNCTCPGYRNRGACIHSEAARLFTARQSRPRYEDIYPAECGARGCSRPVVSEGSCKRHQLVDAF